MFGSHRHTAMSLSSAMHSLPAPVRCAILAENAVRAQELLWYQDSYCKFTVTTESHAAATILELWRLDLKYGPCASQPIPASPAGAGGYAGPP